MFNNEYNELNVEFKNKLKLVRNSFTNFSTNLYEKKDSLLNNSFEISFKKMNEETKKNINKCFDNKKSYFNDAVMEVINNYMEFLNNKETEKTNNRRCYKTIVKVLTQLTAKANMNVMGYSDSNFAKYISLLNKKLPISKGCSFSRDGFMLRKNNDIFDFKVFRNSLDTLLINYVNNVYNKAFSNNEKIEDIFNNYEIKTIELYKNETHKIKHEYKLNKLAYISARQELISLKKELLLKNKILDEAEEQSKTIINHNQPETIPKRQFNVKKIIDLIEKQNQSNEKPLKNLKLNNSSFF